MLLNSLSQYGFVFMILWELFPSVESADKYNGAFKRDGCKSFDWASQNHIGRRCRSAQLWGRDIFQDDVQGVRQPWGPSEQRANCMKLSWLLAFAFCLNVMFDNAIGKISNKLLTKPKASLYPSKWDTGSGMFVPQKHSLMPDLSITI